MYPRFFVFFTAIFLSGFLLAQPKSIEWVVPLKSDFMVMGKPAPGHFAYLEKGKLYLGTPGAESRMLPYDSISFLHPGMWEVWKKGLKGLYADVRGELLPPVYQDITPGAAGCWAFTVQKYGMVAVVNDANEVILPWRAWEYIGLNPLNDTILEYIDKKGYNFTNMGYVTRKGKNIPLEQKERFLTGVFRRLAADKYVFYSNPGGKMKRDTFASATEFMDDIAVVKKGASFGYLRRNGSWLIAPRFQAAGPFNSGGLAAAKEKDRFGILQKNGSWAVAPQFEDLKTLPSGLFQFREGTRSGLADARGKIILPAATYEAILNTDTESFGVKVADTIQIYNSQGTLLPVSRAISYEGHGNYFLITQKITDEKGRKSELKGLALSATGEWLIPPVLRGRVKFGKYFIAVEALVQGTDKLAGVLIEGQPAGKYLVFNRAGKLLTPETVEITDLAKEPYTTFSQNKKTGLLGTEGPILSAEYDQIRLLGNGWIAVKKQEEKGLIRWKGGE